MKQVIQDFKTGDLFVGNVPIPSISKGYVLVRNHFSLISAGTERNTVSTAKASLIGKARQRPDLVKQVIDTFKKQGFAETLKRVQTKLATLKELGYSSAGTVVASMDTKNLFKPGNRVACGGGGFASHSGFVAVPQNLVVKIPDSLPLEQAAFTTLGAIAMQGVRQASPNIGDYVCVIGLGLLGQITSQILRANGCNVFGIDTSSTMVEIARRLSCHRTLPRDNAQLEDELDSFTEGHGFDTVIITAAAKSNDPVDLSTRILRQKGVIVIVGAVLMNIQRDPYFYQKELELKISCSYGPGRYDHSYEEEGHDYPYGYVRWTENRNMAAIVKLMANKAITVEPLITQTFSIDDAEKAYDIVTGKTQEHHIAILLQYPETEEQISKTPKHHELSKQGSICMGFVGAGSFAQKYLIPYAKSGGNLKTVATARGINAKNVADKFGFQRFTTNVQEILSDNDINAVFIATRHDTHADLAVSAIESGKNVFVEKPLTIDEQLLASIADASRRHSDLRLMVGFNRRFSPLAAYAKEVFKDLSEPLIINYRVNAGFLPLNHWTQTDEGGGRILGEVCHFVDFLQYLTDSEPAKVFAECVSNTNSKTNNYDNVLITISFKNGSVGCITYVSCGGTLLSKEYIEIFGGNKSFIVKDFSEGVLYCDGKRKIVKTPGKGHKQEVEFFIKSIQEGLASPIHLDSLLYTTATTFRIIDSLQTGLPQVVTIP